MLRRDAELAQTLDRVPVQMRAMALATGNADAEHGVGAVARCGRRAARPRCPAGPAAPTSSAFGSPRAAPASPRQAASGARRPALRRSRRRSSTRNRVSAARSADERRGGTRPVAQLPPPVARHARNQLARPSRADRAGRARCDATSSGAKAAGVAEAPDAARRTRRPSPARGERAPLLRERAGIRCPRSR